MHCASSPVYTIPASSFTSSSCPSSSLNWRPLVVALTIDLQLNLSALSHPHFLLLPVSLLLLPLFVGSDGVYFACLLLMLALELRIC